MTEVLGLLPSQQPGQLGSRPAKTDKSAGGRKRPGKGGFALTTKATKVKEEAALQMSLRAKRAKKGFYSIRNLEHLAWCKGRGTKTDPLVID